jgi:hypothetical protein
MSMKQELTQLTDTKYQKFIDHVNSFKQTRYYIIKFVSIADLRSQNKTNDEIANIVAEYSDDQEWPSTDSVAQGFSVPPSPISEEEVSKIVTRDLAGGSHYGHIDYAIQPEEAENIWQEFKSLFTGDKTFYSVALGDPAYTFYGGALIVGKDTAGVLNIVQDD